MLKLKKVATKHGKSFNWHITGTHLGVRVRESTGTASRAVAERLLAQRQAELEDEAVNGRRVDCNFAEAAIHYIRHGGERRFLKPLIERFGEKAVSAITPADITAHVDAALAGRSGAYIARVVYTPINAVINRAAKAGLCLPRSFSAPSYKHSKRPHAPDEWLVQVMNAVGQTRPRLAALMLFCTFTGSRCGEACALTVDKIDWNAGYALIHESKTDTHRRVRLHPQLFAKLVEIRDDVQPGETLFGYADQRSVNHAVKRFCDRMGLDYYSSHQWGRKGFVTRHLVDGKKSTKWVADAGGWANTRMIDRHYAHLEQSVLDEGMVYTGGRIEQMLRITEEK